MHGINPECVHVKRWIIVRLENYFILCAFEASVQVRFFYSFICVASFVEDNTRVNKKLNWFLAYKWQQN